MPQLEFKLAGLPHHPVEWWLNGQKLGVKSSNSLFWPLQKGQWILQARMGQMTAQVSFQVRLSSFQHTRQGFSIK
ncbi:MAG: hypothetical protein NVSMB70_02700 [Chamaesiphon sp.]